MMFTEPLEALRVRKSPKTPNTCQPDHGMLIFMEIIGTGSKKTFVFIISLKKSFFHGNGKTTFLFIHLVPLVILAGLLHFGAEVIFSPVI